MFQHDHKALLEAEEFAALGNNLVAYMREMRGWEIAELIPDTSGLHNQTVYWVLFAADGEPLMVSDQASELMNGAFYNDLEAILPN